MSKVNNAQRKDSFVRRLLAPILGRQVLRNRTLIAVSLTVCAAYVGIGMVAPVRILYAQSRGASLAIIGAMASAYLISNFAAQYPSGWLADRWGRKQIMILGLLVQAGLSLSYLFITDPVWFVVLRFAEGIAAAAVLPSARALIADAISEEGRGEAYGVFGAFFNAGFLLGPALGGFLAATGYSIAFIGAVISRIVAVIIVITMIHINVKSPQETQAQAKKVPLRALFKLPLVGAYILAFGDYLYLGFDLALVPLWLHDHLGASVTAIGLVYVLWAIGSIIMSPIGGRIADRTRRSWLILIFGLAQVPFYITYGLANSAWLIIALAPLHAIIYSLVQPAVDSHVATASAVNARARVQGMYSTVGLIGAFVGANGFALLYGLNFRLPLFAMGAAYGICVIIGGLMIRYSESHDLISASYKAIGQQEEFLDELAERPQELLSSNTQLDLDRPS